jgi:hypothetical protein
MTRAGRAEDHRRVVPAWRTSETASLAIFGASLVGWVLIGLSKLRAFGGPGLGVPALDARGLGFGHDDSVVVQWYCWDLLHVFNVWQFTNLVEWGLHALSHKRFDLPFLRDLHRIHMEHHKRHYPIGKLLRDGPYRDGGGATVFLPLISLIVLAAYWMLRTRLFVIFLVEGLGLQAASTYLHDQFHVRGSWLERYAWFLRRRYRHFYHHGHLQKNMSLGGVDKSWDAFFGTFVDVVLPAEGSDLNVVPRKKDKAARVGGEKESVGEKKQADL